MVTQAQLEASVRNLPQSTPIQLNQKGVNLTPKTYEAYMFGLCLRAARELGCNPVLQGVKGLLPIPLIFRGSPGKIYATSNQNYGYATFQLNGQDFEIHAGIEFEGSSGMRHELDVCIMEAAPATKCRAKSKDPKSTGLIVGLECKFYGKRLDKVLGRAFMGLMADMGTKPRMSAVCSNSENPNLLDFFSLKGRPRAHFNLTPLPANIANEQAFVAQIKGELRTLAKI